MISSAFPLILVVGAVILLAITGNLFSSSPFVIAAQVGAVVLNVWARLSFEKGAFRVSAAPGSIAIIRRGPFGLIRHPMYAAALLFVWAAVAGHVSAFTLGVGVAVTVLTVARVVAEERLLRAEYPDYEEYAEGTKALVPFVF